MRIISGRLGGRPICAPGGEGTRPAMARTREAVFSMLNARGMIWPDARVLDLFAGSGSLGLEAISRGAAEAVFVENAASACLAKNIANLDLQSQCRIVRQDVARFLRSHSARTFNLVFIDPPYRRNCLAPALNSLCNGEWLAAQAFVVAEIESGLEIKRPRELTEVASKAYGQTLIRIWEKI